MKNLLPEMSEKEFATAFEKLLGYNGFTWYHTHDSRRSVAGFPDYCCIRANPPRFLFAELKTEKGKLSDDQAKWIALLEVVGVEVHIWRPGDLPEINEILSRRRAA